MRRSIICLVAIAVIAMMVCAVSKPCFASGDKRSFKQASKDAARATVNYPANLLNESINVVGKTADSTGKMLEKTAKAAGETLTKDPGQAPKIVQEPIMGTAYTVKDTAVGTAEAPYKAGKETASQIDR